MHRLGRGTQLQSLSLKRNRFLHIIKVSVSPEPDVQRVPKPLKQCTVVRIGWKVGVDSLPVQGDGFVYITSILRFVGEDVQRSCFIPEGVELHT